VRRKRRSIRLGRIQSVVATASSLRWRHGPASRAMHRALVTSSASIVSRIAQPTPRAVIQHRRQRAKAFARRDLRDVADPQLVHRHPVQLALPGEPVRRDRIAVGRVGHDDAFSDGRPTRPHASDARPAWYWSAVPPPAAVNALAGRSTSPRSSQRRSARGPSPRRRSPRAHAPAADNRQRSRPPTA